MIDRSRPIENDYGPCKLLHKLKGYPNQNYVVISLTKNGKEVCLVADEQGSTVVQKFNIRNAIERTEFFVPFEAQKRYGIVSSKPQTILLLGKPLTIMPDELDKFEEAFKYALRLSFENEKPVSAEIIALEKDPK